MRKYFADDKVRAYLFHSLRKSFSFASELDGVPSEYAVALIDLDPVKIASEVVGPVLASITERVSVEFSKLTMDEKDDVISRALRWEIQPYQVSNVVESFFLFINRMGSVDELGGALIFSDATETATSKADMVMEIGDLRDELKDTTLKPFSAPLDAVKLNYENGYYKHGLENSIQKTYENLALMLTIGSLVSDSEIDLYNRTHFLTRFKQNLTFFCDYVDQCVSFMPELLTPNTLSVGVV